MHLLECIFMNHSMRLKLSKMCRAFFDYFFSEKDLPQWLHWYGLSHTLIALLWFLSSVCSHMYFKNIFHWYGFSLVFGLICLTRLLFTKKALSHWLHWYGLSPVCILICILSLYFLSKLCHNGCIGMVYLLYALTCAIRWLLWDNPMPYWLHWYGYSLVCNH